LLAVGEKVTPIIVGIVFGLLGGLLIALVGWLALKIWS
jgi:hypothetical protein